MNVVMVTPVQLWVNPRLIKEADALTEAGHAVTVISSSRDSWSAERDRKLHAQKRWAWECVDLTRDTAGSTARWFCAAIRQKAAFALSSRLASMRVVAEAYFRGYPRVLSLAKRQRADFYIAHTQAALPVAAEAARSAGVGFGFDCEDLNTEALADGMTDPGIRRNILKLEQFYLPQARYVTATSQPMAVFLRDRYGIVMPTVIYNVFPRRELAGIQAPSPRPAGAPVSMAWMSATIGRGRGLEMAVAGMKRLAAHARLSVYGRFLDADFERSLKAAAAPLTDRVQFLSMPQPWEVSPTLAQHDIGLALDDGSCKNLALTICNKFFLYAQAGLAVAATDLPGQRSVWPAGPPIGFLIPPDDEGAFVNGIRGYARGPEKLLAAKQAAWDMGQNEWNWDKQKHVFLKALSDGVERFNYR